MHRLPPRRVDQTTRARRPASVDGGVDPIVPEHELPIAGHADVQFQSVGPQGERVDEDRLSVFRDFINSLDIDDLGKSGGADDPRRSEG